MYPVQTRAKKVRQRHLFAFILEKNYRDTIKDKESNSKLKRMVLEA